MKPGQVSRAAKTSNPLAKVQNTASLKRATSTPQLSNNRRNQALDAAVNSRPARTSNLNDQVSIRSNGASRNGRGAGFSIKGSASQVRDYVVIAQNFAPGTTAEDISSVFAPNPDTAGLVTCRLLVSSPTVIAELIFDNQNTAEDVVKTYNNKKADNRVLYVYHSDAPSTQLSSSASQPRSQGLGARIGSAIPINSSDDSMDVEILRPRYQEPYTPPRPQRAKPEVQDGRYGFGDNVYKPRQETRNQGGLVSDSTIGRSGRGRQDGGVGRLFH